MLKLKYQTKFKSQNSNFKLLGFKVWYLFGFWVLILGFSTSSVSAQESATLFLEPSSGKFTVNNTFTVSIYVDTDGQPINAVEADLKFPPDKLQVVSPTTDTSFFKVWLGVPAYSNSEGTINLKGGIPSPGIISEKGLITKITFRAKSTGQAQIVFTDESKVLADDGLATDILSHKQGATVLLSLPAPQGPIISSPTHPEQNQWYINNNPIFSWDKNNDVTGFSYILNKEPISIPDDTIDSVLPRVKISNVEDGIHFFHVKAHSVDGAWGGVSHYQILVDRTPPAKFPIAIEPRRITSVHRPIINFKTTDNISGIDHYEIKIIRIDQIGNQRNLSPLFLEASPPYQSSELDFGKYDIIVRAYDKAGNFIESESNFQIVSSRLVFEDAGFGLHGIFFFPWWLFWAGLVSLVLFLFWLARHFWLKHSEVRAKLSAGVLNFNHVVNNDLRLLKELQKKYEK